VSLVIPAPPFSWSAAYAAFPTASPIGRAALLVERERRPGRLAEITLDHVGASAQAHRFACCL
jgi:hypothetical protein